MWDGGGRAGDDIRQRGGCGVTGEGSPVDRAGGAEAAADRSAGKHHFGAVPAADDAAALSGGSPVPAIAQLVQAEEVTVRDVIHRFNEIGLACLDPQWAGGRPRLLSIEARTSSSRRPPPVPPRWASPSPAGHSASSPSTCGARPVRIDREAPRCLLLRRGISVQRSKTWTESPDRTSPPRSIGSSSRSPSDRTGRSPWTGSARSASARPRNHVGLPDQARTVCRQPTVAVALGTRPPPGPPGHPTPRCEPLRTRRTHGHRTPSHARLDRPPAPAAGDGHAPTTRGGPLFNNRAYTNTARRLPRLIAADHPTGADTLPRQHRLVNQRGSALGGYRMCALTWL